MSRSEPEPESTDWSSIDRLLEELEAIVCGLLESGASSKEIWYKVIVHDAYRIVLGKSVGAVLRRQELPANEDAKEELISETTLALANRFSRRPRFPWRRKKRFGNWLRRVISRACSEIARRIHRFHRGLRLGDLPDLGAGIPLTKTMERKAAVARAIVLLDEPHKTVLRMALFEKSKQKDIAVELNYSEARISQIVREAVAQVKSILGIEAE